MSDQAEIPRDVQVRIHNLEQLLTSPGWAELKGAVSESMELHCRAVMEMDVQLLSHDEQLLWLVQTITKHQTMAEMLAAPEGRMDELRVQIEEATE